MRWLDAHARSEPVADVVPAHAAWLTGQSSWSHSLLSPRQHATLDVLAAEGWTPVRVGFPWTRRAAGAGPYTPEPLVAASVRNTAQWAAARPGTAFTREAVRHVQALVDRTTSDLLLLCGSAGARIAAAVAPHVVVPDGVRVRVVGLGPVGALPPPGGAWSVHVVRGERDRISRWGHRGPADVVVPGGHLVAATSPEAAAAVRALVGRPGGTATDHGSAGSRGHCDGGPAAWTVASRVPTVPWDERR